MHPIFIAAGRYLLQWVVNLILAVVVAILTSYWIVYTGQGENWLVVAICMLFAVESVWRSARYLYLRNNHQSFAQPPLPT